MKQEAYKKLLQELDAKRSITLKRAKDIYGASFSESTWKRLKKTLKQSYNLELQWDAKTKTFKVPATWTPYPADPDPRKRDSLAELRAAAARVGPPLTDQLYSFLDRLDQELARIDPDVRAKAPVRQPAPRTDKAFFDLLNRTDRAIRNRQIITIDYRKTAGGRLEKRSIAPYELHNHSGRFYVWGTDEGGTKPKFFALDRIEGMSADDGDSFERDPNLSIDKELRHSFGVWVGSGKPQDIEVEISESRATDVFARRWPAEKAVSFQSNGRLRITFSVSDAREVVAWVLSFGGEAWIREPASAAKLAWELSQKIVAQHKWARDVPVDEKLMRFEWGGDGLPSQRSKPSQV